MQVFAIRESEGVVSHDRPLESWVELGVVVIRDHPLGM